MIDVILTYLKYAENKAIMLEKILILKSYLCIYMNIVLFQGDIVGVEVIHDAQT